jgi:hypothetical protein
VSLKRYTLKFQSNYPSISIDDLRGEVEQQLFRLHPRITYKMGQALMGEDGKLLVQFASDGKRHLLDEAFKTVKWIQPVQLECINWGWVVETKDAPSLSTANRAVDSDPLADVLPLEGMGEYGLGKRRLYGRYLALIISTLVLMAVLIGNILYPRSPVFMALYAIVFAAFMFSLSDTPVDIRVYGEKISLRLDGLEVRYWLHTRPRFHEWANIWGVNYANNVCEVLSDNGKQRFLLSERFGCQEQDLVLKTIITRAGLRFVEGDLRKLIYRAPDAGSCH